VQRLAAGAQAATAPTTRKAMLVIRYTCPNCGRTASAADSMAGGLLACSRCNTTIELPPKVKKRKDGTDPLIDLDLGELTAHSCTHCGQTILSAKACLDRQACGRCGKAMRQEISPSDDMVRFQCNGCNKRLKAPSNAGGKGATCRRCGQRVCVPKSPSLDCVPKSPSLDCVPKSPSMDSNPFVFST
jgi:DNA-directed RNA polymerase subunit RPC12/RpoP